MTRSIDMPWGMDEEEVRYPWSAVISRYSRFFGLVKTKRRFKIIGEFNENNFRLEWDDGETSIYTKRTVNSWIEECKNDQIN